MKQYANTRPRVKKTIAVLLIVIGFVALITPLTPGAFLLPIGLQILGIQMLPIERMKNLRRNKKKLLTMSETKESI